MQVSSLSAQLGLGSDLDNWYRDATSVSWGHLLIDLSPRTDDRLRNFTDTGLILSKFCIPGGLKHLNSSDNEHGNIIYASCFPIVFHKLEKSFPSVLPKTGYQISPRKHHKSFRTKPAKHTKTPRKKFSKLTLIAVSKKTTLEQRKDAVAFEKELELIIVITLPVINHLFLTWSSFFLSLLLCTTKVWRLNQLPGRNFHKVSSCTTSYLPNWFSLEGYKQKVICKVDSLVNKLSVLSAYQSLKLAHFTLGWCRNFPSTVTFCSINASQRSRSSRHLLYFNWRCWYISYSGSESKCRNQGDRNLDLFQKKKIRSWMVCTDKVVLLWVCAKHTKSEQATRIETDTILAFKLFFYKIYSLHGLTHENEGIW